MGLRKRAALGPQEKLCASFRSRSVKLHMLAIVRIALSKPYTFIVLAMLIVIAGVSARIEDSHRHFSQHRHTRRSGRLDL